jgi:hypothetical protein
MEEKKKKVKEKEIIKEYEKVKIRKRLNRINKIKKKR